MGVCAHKFSARFIGSADRRSLRNEG